MSEHMHNEFRQVEVVAFTGGELQVIRDEAGCAWMLIPPACEALGLDAIEQHLRLARTPWAVTCIMPTGDVLGQARAFFCLRGDRVAMWLATLPIQRVLPELRERRLQWQCEAADALARWTAGRAPEQPSSSPPPDPRPSPLAELRELIEREVRCALQQQLASQKPLVPLTDLTLRYGILLPCPDAAGWPQLALGVKQSCAHVEADCLTSAKLAQLLRYEAQAVPALSSAVHKLTGRRTLSGRQLGYLLSCAQKRGLVEHDGRLHSHGGYGWSVVERMPATRGRKSETGSPRAWRLPIAEPKVASRAHESAK